MSYKIVTEMSEPVCNITKQGERMRLRFGLVAAAVAVLAAVAMLVLRVPPLWRLVIFLPVAGAGYGILQARAKT
jgi:hypothetical protein